MDQYYINMFLTAIRDVMGPLTARRSEDITFSGGRYNRETGFYLYVGVEGNVHFEDSYGVDQVRHFVVGYHPIRMRAIIESGTLATDLAACFNP